MQVQRYFRVSHFSLARTQTAPKPATVAPKRNNFVTGDDIASPMYDRCNLIQRATDCRQEDDENLRRAKKRQKKNYDRRVQVAHIFRAADHIFLDTSPLMRAAVERSASEGYDKWLPRRQVPCNVITVNETTLQILQDGLDLTVSIHRATLIPTSRRQCDETKGLTEPEPRSATNSD